MPIEECHLFLCTSAKYPVAQRSATDGIARLAESCQPGGWDGGCDVYSILGDGERPTPPKIDQGLAAEQAKGVRPRSGRMWLVNGPGSWSRTKPAFSERKACFQFYPGTWLISIYLGTVIDIADNGSLHHAFQLRFVRCNTIDSKPPVKWDLDGDPNGANRRPWVVCWSYKHAEH